MPKTPTENINETELLEQNRFASEGRTRMQCPMLVFKLLRDRAEIPEKAYRMRLN